MEKLKYIGPFEIRRIQTDKASEFEKVFKDYLQRNGIVHFHNYPKHPQSNAHLERFNRTIQDQYINLPLDDFYDIKKTNKGLMNYLICYNTEKPYKSLNKLSPLRCYLNTTNVSFQKSNMLWTLINYLQLNKIKENKAN